MGLDRYKIGDKIGEGSFAKVYAAENEHGELVGGFIFHKVAIKVLDLSLHSSPKDSERIVNECKILQSLNHANIVDLIEVTIRATLDHSVRTEALPGYGVRRQGAIHFDRRAAEVNGLFTQAVGRHREIDIPPVD